MKPDPFFVDSVEDAMTLAESVAREAIDLPADLQTKALDRLRSWADFGLLGATDLSDIACERFADLARAYAADLLGLESSVSARL